MKRIFLFLLFPYILLSAESPVVETSSGPVSGTAKNGVEQYLGIPYAEPPVGELRWVPPKEHKLWKNILKANKFGPACPQPQTSLVPDLGTETSEDCLYLNIWAPKNNNRNNFPVIVWIHGGGLYFGGSSQPVYNGAKLAKKGVVFVSINYRLGPFGFAAHPELSKESEKNISGNYGLLDMLFALKWIKKNIGYFGGDADNITITGQSSGATAVCVLMASPLSRGLFNKAIAASPMGGAPGRLRKLKENTGNLESMETLGIKFFKVLGVDSLSTARKKDPWKVIEAWNKTIQASTSGLLPSGSSTVNHINIDGYILTELPSKTFAGGGTLNIPFITGAVKNEGSLFSLSINNEKDFKRYLREHFPGNAEELEKKYPIKEYTAVRYALGDLISDLLYLKGVKAAAANMSLIQNSTFMYLFDFPTISDRNVDVGSFHGSELPFFFNTFGGEHYGKKELELSEKITDYFINFARTGDPNSPGLPEWPKYTKKNEEYLILKEKPATGKEYRKAFTEYLDTIYP